MPKNIFNNENQVKTKKTGEKLDKNLQNRISMCTFLEKKPKNLTLNRGIQCKSIKSEVAILTSVSKEVRLKIQNCRNQ